MRSVLVAVFLCAISIDAKCLIRGSCGKGDPPQPPCAVNQEFSKPRKLSPGKYKVLQKICPEFADGQELCCDDGQAQQVYENLNRLFSITASCPSCSYNLARIFCKLTCAPNQDEFLLITNSTKTDLVPPPREGDMRVISMSYYLDEDYINKSYDSCREVQNPQTGYSLQLLCGANGLANCSPRKLLEYMGSAPDPSPFEIDFKYERDGHEIEPINFKSTKCSEPAVPGGSPCSCGGCSEVCPPFPLPPDSHPLCIFGIDVFTLGGSLLFILVVSAFAAALYQRKRGSSSLGSEVENLSPGGEERGESVLTSLFEGLGGICTNYPWSVTAVVLLLCIVCSLGNLKFVVVTDPVELWSSPTNQARVQRDYFNSHLAPFYRIEQVIIKNTGGERFEYTSPLTKNSYTFGPVFDFNFLRDIFELQLNISSWTAAHKNETVTLQDICFSPLDQKCAIQSVPNWFQSDLEVFESKNSSYLEHVVDCINSATLIADFDSNNQIGCLGAYGGPTFSYVALGDYEEDPKLAGALVLTFLVNNHVKDADNEKAQAWEREFIKNIKQYSHPNMSLAFLSEVSINDELMLQSKSDISVVLISYLLMFVYISIALGRIQSFSTFFVHSQIVLGAVGVLLVLLSVVTSIGIFSFFGIPSTLIIFEVIPFLVLAVGVDNMFILVQAVQRTPKNDQESVEEHISRVLGVVGPSMLMASASECTCFFLGAMITMPAIRAFALYAGMALLVDFILQITVFVSLLTLDARRQQSKRLDLFCCIARAEQDDEEQPEDSFLHQSMKKFFAPLLRHKSYRYAVLFAFMSWMCFSVAVVNKLEVGLDQKLSMPRDSYMQDYFSYLSKYLNAGPPVYFVVGDKFDYGSEQNQNLLGSFIGSNSYSLVNDVKQASKASNKTYISTRSMSWIDDFFAWSKQCCFENEKTHERCMDGDDDCVSCFNDTDSRPNGFPRHLADFLSENPDENCPVAGHAAYAAAVELHGDRIGASSFMSYHSVLRTNADFIAALEGGRFVAQSIEDSIKKNYSGNPDDVEVFPYSVFYVYYEQYLTIWRDTITQLALSFAGVTVITFIFMKFEIVPSLSICFTIFLIVLDLMGVMYLVDIQLNAVSLVNLVMSVGISVEFCSHIARAFSESCHGSAIDRAIHAVSTTGSSVLSGITLTKFVGVSVLAFADSQLFVVFYFKMYLGIVLIGSLHGLIFLPVFLATFGGSKGE